LTSTIWLEDYQNGDLKEPSDQQLQEISILKKCAREDIKKMQIVPIRTIFRDAVAVGLTVL